MAANRRRHVRHRLDQEVVLHLAGKQHRARIVDLGAGGLRLVCGELELADERVLQIYLALADDRRVVAWGHIVRRDDGGVAIAFDRVEPDGEPLLADGAVWQLVKPTEVYVSPASSGRRSLRRADSA
jgi:hypothetical protein